MHVHSYCSALKPFVWWRSRRRCRRGLLKLPIRDLKDVRAHCYCASLVRTLFIGHARATSFSSARTESKT